MFYNAIVFSKVNALLFFSRFLFIYALTLPFDIRDIKTDAENNLKTLPVKFGLTTTKIIATISLLAFCFLIFYRVQSQPELSHVAMAFYISAVISAIVVLVSQPGNKLFFYDVLVEGMSVLQAVLVFALI